MKLLVIFACLAALGAAQRRVKPKLRGERRPPQSPFPSRRGSRPPVGLGRVPPPKEPPCQPFTIKRGQVVGALDVGPSTRGSFLACMNACLADKDCTAIVSLRGKGCQAKKPDPAKKYEVKSGGGRVFLRNKACESDNSDGTPAPDGASDSGATDPTPDESGLPADAKPDAKPDESAPPAADANPDESAANRPPPPTGPKPRKNKPPPPSKPKKGNPPPSGPCGGYTRTALSTRPGAPLLPAPPEQGKPATGGVDGCKAVCDKYPDCKGFTYQLGEGRCYLKGGELPPLERNPRNDAYDRQPACPERSCGGYKRQPKKTMFGATLKLAMRVRPTANAQSRERTCKAICDRFASCKGFVMRLKKYGGCIFKKENVGLMKPSKGEDFFGKLPAC